MCPDCRTALAQEAHHDVTIDFCPECAGIWFDMGELGRLMRDPEESIAEVDEHLLPHVERKLDPTTNRMCPCCNQTLYRYHYLYTSPIELDACEQCSGFWVEDGELEKIVQWRAQTHTAPLPEDKKVEVALVESEFDIRHKATLARALNVGSMVSLVGRRPWYWNRI